MYSMIAKNIKPPPPTTTTKITTEMTSEDTEKNFLDVLNFLIVNIVVLGFAGNFMCFKIFNSSHLRKHPISVFFRVIAFFDSIMLVNATFFFIYRKFDIDLSNYNAVFCKFKSYLIYSNGPISPWLMVIISFDRFISIGFPKKFSFLFKLNFQIAIICIIVVFNYSFYSFMFFNTYLVAG